MTLKFQNVLTTKFSEIVFVYISNNKLAVSKLLVYEDWKRRIIRKTFQL